MSAEPGSDEAVADLLPDAEALLDAVGTAFSKLRRRTMSVPVDPPVHRTDLRRDLVLTAVEEAGEGLSVGDLADKLMIDSPAASRQAAGLVAAGYLVRIASQADGRRTMLQLTPAGAQALTHSRRQQRQAFEFITRAWPTEERLELARLLIKYSEATAAPGAPDSAEVD